MSKRLRRREFITLLGGAAGWPLAARAQQPAKPRTIGYLGSSTASTQGQWTTAFALRLRELGWVDGRNLAIAYRWAEGRPERFPDFANEFVRMKVDAIVTIGTPAVLALKQATSTIPIVFAAAVDPIASGLIASLARPGGNITGLSIQGTDLAGKRIELLREFVPRLRTLAIMANAGSPAAVLEMGEVQATARTLGLQAAPLEIRRAEDIAPSLELLKGRVDALYVCVDGLVTTHRVRISTLALGARLPTMHVSREHVEAGGLMSYGPSFSGPVSPCRRHRRQASARNETGGHPGRAADQIRSGREPDHGEGARPRSVTGAARPRRRGDRMNIPRRDVMRLISLAVSWPIAARAQQAPPRMLRVGTASPNPRAFIGWVAFDRRMRELGYIEGQNLAFEFVHTGDRIDRVSEAIQEFVQRKVDVIVESSGRRPGSQGGTGGDRHAADRHDRD